jgi:outer membrane biosynthesis protein TonB
LKEVYNLEKDREAAKMEEKEPKPESKVEEKPKKSAKSKEEPKTKEKTAYVNAYGFIHLSTEQAEAFGVEKGKKTPITMEFKEGALIIRKA